MVCSLAWQVRAYGSTSAGKITSTGASRGFATSTAIASSYGSRPRSSERLRRVLFGEDRVEVATRAFEHGQRFAEYFDVAALGDVPGCIFNRVHAAHRVVHDGVQSVHVGVRLGILRALLEQFGTFFGDGVNALAVALLPANEIAVFEHLQRRIDRSGTRPGTGFRLDLQHDVVSVTRTGREDGKDFEFHFAASATAESA